MWLPELRSPITFSTVLESGRTLENNFSIHLAFSESSEEAIETGSPIRRDTPIVFVFFPDEAFLVGRKA